MEKYKFRAWDKMKKRWCVGIVGYELEAGDASSAIHIAITDEGKILGVSNYSNVEVVRFSEDEIEISKFTGLLDKNGKEIYEGDIVKLDKDWQGRSSNGKKIGAIEYDQCCFSLELYDSLPLYLTTSSVLEIIGNIYEHPTLLI